MKQAVTTFLELWGNERLLLIIAKKLDLSQPKTVSFKVRWDLPVKCQLRQLNCNQLK